MRASLNLAVGSSRRVRALAVFIATGFVVPSPNYTFAQSGTSQAGPGAQPEHTPKPVTAPIDIVVPIAPTAFQADGEMHLVYELHASNCGKWDCALTRVEVVTGGGAAKS